MKQEFIDALNRALGRLGYANRSDFIRDAILEKLEAEHEFIDHALAAPPPRSGKPGKPKRRVGRVITQYPPDPHGGSALNDAPKK